jgi:hypothetical protein
VTVYPTRRHPGGERPIHPFQLFIFHGSPRSGSSTRGKM